MPLSEEISGFIRQDALRRFLSYVTVHTTSEEDTGRHPSTERQRALAEQLRLELVELGLDDVELDEHCYLYATVPASAGSVGPVVGLLAHLDTSPSVSGENVKPLVRTRYDGSPLSFPDDPSLSLTPDDSPELLHFVGDKIVTASGRTLLGADDKAGIAEIVCAAAVFRSHPELPHPELRLCFTPDEEVGAGTDRIRVQKLGRIAYTLDGGMVGELEFECFDARGAKIRFRGMNMHPGYAKDRMVNAGAAAARFLAALPEWQSPEHTEGREGFLHLGRITGDESEAELHFIIRDFTAAGNDRRIDLLRAERESFLARYPGLGIEIDVREQYRNMKEVLDRHLGVVETARDAMKAAGIAAIQRAIRGGTDGARLCFMGLPTPNLFAGGMLAHSRKEWIPVSALVKATELVLTLSGLWHGRRL